MYTPLVVPDILMGMSLLMFFVALAVPLGLFTIFLAHVTFCISYVAMVVLARLQDFDFSMVEAARDLGAGAGHDPFGGCCCRCWRRASWPAGCWPSRCPSTTS